MGPEADAAGCVPNIQVRAWREILSPVLQGIDANATEIPRSLDAAMERMGQCVLRLQ